MTDKKPGSGSNSQEWLEVAIQSIEGASNQNELEALRVKYLGRKGVATEALRQVGSLPADQRAKAGAKANSAQHQIEQTIAKVKQDLLARRVEREAKDTPIDLTAPQPFNLGHDHPVNSLIRDVIQIFWQMGFQVAEGPEIETQWYNFEALNIPLDHPARDMQDTFYLDNNLLPRTHTSGVQVRYMEANKPPIRIIAPGKVYRNEDEDPTHLWMFHQIEGLVVDKGISLGDLKGTLTAMLKGLLGDETQLRLRPSYFPYTEPSVEVDATCVICKGKGCRTCAGTGWIELGGAGMVHPEVLLRVGIDPSVYSGFAFGFGPERIAAIKYQIPDIRYFWRPDIRFLEQFR